MLFRSKKKPILLLLCLFLFIIGQAQVSKTINVTTPGTLSTLLTVSELSTVTNLTVTGSIDARDFKTMRDNMLVLSNTDLRNSIIKAYIGDNGTDKWNMFYSDNELPGCAFYLNTTLTSIQLPKTIFCFPELITIEVAMRLPNLLQRWRKPGLIMIVWNAITIIMGISHTRALAPLLGIRKYFGPSSRCKNQFLNGMY